MCVLFTWHVIFSRRASRRRVCFGKVSGEGRVVETSSELNLVGLSQAIYKILQQESPADTLQRTVQFSQIYSVLVRCGMSDMTGSEGSCRRSRQCAASAGGFQRPSDRRNSLLSRIWSWWDSQQLVFDALNGCEVPASGWWADDVCTSGTLLGGIPGLVSHAPFWFHRQLRALNAHRTHLWKYGPHKDHMETFLNVWASYPPMDRWMDEMWNNPYNFVSWLLLSSQCLEIIRSLSVALWPFFLNQSCHKSKSMLLL